ncbi:hypothetical protein PCANC_16387 [Puccinia coronata f. sp. avenae]|uniref:OTU domain-containing protein n=1 Tax=Puccinia coronata f. sp. avenae TaxID=200324 RepID=A0A2N5U896_9BASI|nr:hypothetical protein PCANC_16387 [Puccinia coronata f. sp. avenae]
MAAPNDTNTPPGVLGDSNPPLHQEPIQTGTALSIGQPNLVLRPKESIQVLYSRLGLDAAATWSWTRRQIKRYVEQDNLFRIPNRGLLQAREHMVQHPIRHTVDFIKSDGNCMFRAISQWKYGNQKHHAKIRADLIGCSNLHKDTIEEEMAGNGVGPGSQEQGGDQVGGGLEGDQLPNGPDGDDGGSDGSEDSDWGPMLDYLLGPRMRIMMLPSPHPEDYDLDSWCVSVAPQQISRIVGPMAVLTLSYHQLAVQDHKDYAKYLHLAGGGCTMRIHPSFKDAVLKALWERFHIIAHPSTKQLILTKGSPACTVAMLAEVMVQIGVEHVRLASYGMKCPYRLVEEDLGSRVPRCLALHQKKNRFDVGFTYYPYHGTERFREEILLAKRPDGIARSQSDSYPLLLELGEGFGSVSLVPDHEAIKRLKCYSSLAHSLKATSQKDMKSPPTTAVTWNRRLNSLIEKRATMGLKDRAEICGLRFEATVWARTANEAQQIVHRSGYLHPLSKYFAYVDLMIEKLKRMQLEIPQAHDNRKEISMQQKQAILDEHQRRTVAGGWSKDNPNKIPTPCSSPNQNDAGKQTKAPPEPGSKSPSKGPTIRPKSSRGKSEGLSKKVDEDLERIRKGTSSTSRKETLEELLANFQEDKRVGWLGFAEFLLEQNLFDDNSGHIPPDLVIPTVSPPDILDGWKVSHGFIKGDGNCLFRAVATWVCGDQEAHQEVRRKCCKEMAQNPDKYSPFVTRGDLEGKASLQDPDIFGTFLTQSQESGFWGGDHHLVALSCAYQIRLVDHLFMVNGANHYEIIWNPSLHSVSPSSSSNPPATQVPPPKNKTSTQTVLKSTESTKDPTETLLPKKIVTFQEATPANSQLREHFDPRLLAVAPTSPPLKSTIEKIRKTKPVNPANTSLPKRQPVVVIPRLNPVACKFPWNQPLSPELKEKKRVRVLGLEKNQGLPIVDGYWTEVNEKLMLETWERVQQLPRGTIRFALPLGLLDGWRISHDLIRTTTSTKSPDSSGFYHALSYWMHGHQDLHEVIRRRVADGLGKIIPQMKPKKKEHSILSAILNPEDPRGIVNLVSDYTSASEGRKPGRTALLAVAGLLRVHLVIVEMGRTGAAWIKCSPQGLLFRGITFPTIYLFYNSTMKRYQILWSPKVHQGINEPGSPKRTTGPGNANLQYLAHGTVSISCPPPPARPPATAITKPALKQTQESPATLATTNKAPEKPKEPCQPLATPSATEKAPEKPKKTRFAPLRPSPSPQPPTITFGPPTKRKPPPQRPPSMPTSEDLKKVNFTPVFYLLMNYLSRDVCRKRCDAINQWPHFPVGDFKHVGWRLSLGYFEDDKNTLWRALSFWRYGKQDSFAAVKGQFDHTGQAGNVIMMYTLELKEPEWEGPQMKERDLKTILEKVANIWGIRIVHLRITNNIAHVDTFVPKDKTGDSVTAGINRSNTAVRAVLEQPCSTGGRTGTVRPKHLPAGRTGLSDQFLGPVAQDQPGPVGQICPTSWLSLRSDSVRPTTGRTRLFEHRSSSRVRPVNAGSEATLVLGHSPIVESENSNSTLRHPTPEAQAPPHHFRNHF